MRKVQWKGKVCKGDTLRVQSRVWRGRENSQGDQKTHSWIVPQHSLVAGQSSMSDEGKFEEHEERKT